ncbi:uncharacterized protein LOC130933727 [Arachis stenosperma]|uniref:uncharacterized protein LOC130933727 n=1 Tax=Arachis stenosperma TaxID=217475 RepID=UPI0025AD58D7|nr:uncharacterized protein LOC130933727 [Arachis stenosperma]
MKGCGEIKERSGQIRRHPRTAVQKRAQPAPTEVPTPRPNGLRPQGSPRGLLWAPHRRKSPSKEVDPSWVLLAVDDGRFQRVITRFGIPEVIISDNGTQFADKKFTEFLNGLGIRQRFSSVEHPRTNGQVESANKVILSGLKKRLDNKKGAWADELASVLWSYRTTEQSSTKETPFRLTYGVDAVIPVEIGEPSPRLLLKGVEETVEKDLIEEAREMAHLTETALKQRVALRYNTKVLKREFGANDLVLRRNDIGLPTPGEGKLAANWEGPYRIKKVMGKGAFKLERLDGKEVPRTWNADNLRRFYS